MGDNNIATSIGNPPGTRNANQIDFSHPFYLHSSDSPGMSLVNFIFDGRGFQGWRRTILIAFSAKNKLRFIDSTCKIPDRSSLDYYLWSRCNDMELSDLVQANTDVAGKQKLTKSLEDEKLFRFLMGLNETYAPARSNILIIKPLPNLNHAYSLLLQDENQRESYVNVSTGPSFFMVGKQGNNIPQSYVDNQGYVANQAYVN
ncbi:hypothetical protein KY285_000498 [Solanum tuberosum]|nr:hypothetical protein KY285_000498 [Solanum tuberosum]